MNRILPSNKSILILGNAKFGNAFGNNGLPSGLAGRFVKACKLVGRTVIEADEWRSSMIDSEQMTNGTHNMMYHPPKKMAENRNGKHYLQRV